MFLISLSVHMTSIFILCLIHVLNNRKELTEPAVLVSMIVMTIIALLFIPIFGLTGFHMVLVSRGRTTNEQVTGKFRGGYNPFSKSVCYNCCYTLCGPQYPRYVLTCVLYLTKSLLMRWAGKGITVDSKCHKKYQKKWNIIGEVIFLPQTMLYNFHFFSVWNIRQNTSGKNHGNTPFRPNLWPQM